MEQKDETPPILLAESLFGMNARRGLVKLSNGLHWEICMTPREAREYAQSINEAAEAAETDEILWNFLTDKINVTDDDAKAMILADLRRIRLAIDKRNRGEFRRVEIEDLKP
jgi:hypothetical protein